MQRRLTTTLALAIPLALSGCSLFGGGSDNTKQDQIEKLQVPPDLTLEKDSSALTIPEGEQNNKTQKPVTASGHEANVAPDIANVSVHRAGGDRWLTVDASPSKTWGWVDDYLKRQGVAIARSNAELGVIETEWLYTNQPVSGGVFAPTVSGPDKATVADRYLLRVEPGFKQGTTDVFVAQRRAARDSQGDWRLMSSDPFLEAELLRSLSVYFGANEQQSFENVATAEAAPATTSLERDKDGRLTLTIDNAFPNAWRRMGLALDRGGFTVIDRNRAKHYYAIRYDTRARVGPEKKSFFSSLAFWRDNPPPSVKTFHIVLEKTGSDRTRARVNTDDGKSASADLTEQILGLIQDQIR